MHAVLQRSYQTVCSMLCTVSQRAARAGRWFPADQVQAPPAAWLDVILYSREQLLAERAALPRSAPAADLPEAPWGIISIKARRPPVSVASRARTSAWGLPQLLPPPHSCRVRLPNSPARLASAHAVRLADVPGVARGH